MLDPVSLLALSGTFLSSALQSEAGKAVINYSSDKLAETALGGYIANRADHLACKLFGSVFVKVKNLWTKDQLPRNADLARAVREANLYATQFLVHAVARQWQEQYRGAGDKYVKRQEEELKKAFEGYLKKQKDVLGAPYPEGHNDPSYGKIERLLAASDTTGQTILQLRQQLIKEVKDSLVLELKVGLNMQELPDLLVNYLYKGWSQEGKLLDWFDIMTLKFSEILKDPKEERAQKAFTDRLLSDIKIEMETIGVDVKEILRKMDELIPLQDFVLKQWPAVKSWMGELDANIKEIKGTTDRIEGSLNQVRTQLEIFAEQLDSKERNTFMRSAQVIELAGTIVRLKAEVESSYAKYIRRKRAYDDEPDEDKLELLELAEANWFKTAENLQKAEKELKGIRSFVRETNAYFSKQEMSAASEINQLAQAYFEKGEFDKVRELLSSEEREAQREELLQRYEQALMEKKDFASGDVFNAKAILVDFKDADRFNKATAYFEKSLAIYAYYNNCFEYAYFLAAQNKHHKAIQLYKQSLTFLDSDEIESRAGTLNNLGNLLSANNDPSAKAHYQEALDIYRQLAEQNPAAYLPYVAGTLNNLGNLLSANNDPSAKAHYQEALDIYRQLAEQNPAAYLPYVAGTLNNLGILLRQNNDPAARAHYQEALDIRRRLAEQNPAAYLPDVAETLNSLGILLSVNNDPSAKAHFQEALGIRRRLAEQNPAAYLPYVAETLNSLGILLSVNNDPSAKAHFQEALGIRRRLAEQNPAAYLPYVAETLNSLGNLLLQNNDPAARAHYQEALDIRRRLAEQNPAAYLPNVAMTLNNLGNLLCQNNDPAARAHYQEALDIYRQLAEQNPAAYLPYVAMTLNNLGNLLWQNNDPAARAHYQEALDIYRQLAEQNPAAYLPYVAGTLNNLGNLLLQNNDPAARAHYQEALDIYRQLAEQNPSRFLPKFLQTANNFAILLEGQGENEHLIVLYKEIINCLLLLFQAKQATPAQIKAVVITSNKRCWLFLNQSEHQAALEQIKLSVSLIYRYKEAIIMNEEIDETHRLAALLNTNMETLWKDHI